MEKNPTVLLIGPLPPAVGGITTYISDLLNSDLKDKFKLIPFATNRPPNKDKIPTTTNYQIIFDLQVKYLLKCIVFTTYHMLIFPITLLRKKPDIIHIHTSSYVSFLENSYYVLVSNIFKKKVVFHIHGSAFDQFYLTSSHFMKSYIKLIMSLSNRIISLSEGWKNFFVVNIGLNKDLISVVPNGVIFSKYNLRQEPKVDDGKFTVLFIGGTDAKRKGAYEVIKAIPLVLKEYPDVTFTFVGSGQIDEIKKMCRDLKIENNVQILGQVSESKKISLLNCSDIFLLPSYAEGLPIAILEAMAAGLPVISTTVGAIPEVIEDDVNGYLIKPGDYEALAKKILILIKDDRIRSEIKKNNRSLVLKDYDVTTVINNITSVYITVLCKMKRNSYS